MQPNLARMILMKVRFKFIQMKLILRGEGLASTRPKGGNLVNFLLKTSNRNATIQFTPPVKMSACHWQKQKFLVEVPFSTGLSNWNSICNFMIFSCLMYIACNFTNCYPTTIILLDGSHSNYIQNYCSYDNKSSNGKQIYIQRGAKSILSLMCKDRINFSIILSSKNFKSSRI